jgi:hypothetical protein
MPARRWYCWRSAVYKALSRFDKKILEFWPADYHALASHAAGMSQSTDRSVLRYSTARRGSMTSEGYRNSLAPIWLVLLQRTTVMKGLYFAFSIGLSWHGPKACSILWTGSDPAEQTHDARNARNKSRTCGLCPRLLSAHVDCWHRLGLQKPFRFLITCALGLNPRWERNSTPILNNMAA